MDGFVIPETVIGQWFAKALGAQRPWHRYIHRFPARLGSKSRYRYVYINPGWSTTNSGALYELAKGWARSLTEEERSAWEVYTNENRPTVNQMLRRKGGVLYDARMVAEATLMKNTLYRMAAPADLVVWRAGSSNALTRLNGKKTFTDAGFVSTSLRFAGTSGFRYPRDATVFCIKIPKGTPCAYLATISQHSDENELVLPPGTQFAIESIKMVPHKEQMAAQAQAIVTCTAQVALSKSLALADSYRVSGRKSDTGNRFTWQPEDFVFDDAGDVTV
jgi:hypothetical protein